MTLIPILKDGNRSNDLDIDRLTRIGKGGWATVHGPQEGRDRCRCAGAGGHYPRRTGHRYPALTENVAEDTKIVVTRISYRTREEVSEIPFETKTERTPTLKDGTTKVVTAGVPGQKTTVYKEYVVDGVVQESEVVEERIDKKPVTETVLLGDKTAPVSPLAAPASLALDANGNPTSYVKKLTGKGTAYSARKGAKTASGRYAVVGHVAR